MKNSWNWNKWKPDSETLDFGYQAQESPGLKLWILPRAKRVTNCSGSTASGVCHPKCPNWTEFYFAYVLKDFKRIKKIFEIKKFQVKKNTLESPKTYEKKINPVGTMDIFCRLTCNVLYRTFKPELSYLINGL